MGNQQEIENYRHLLAILLKCGSIEIQFLVDAIRDWNIYTDEILDFLEEYEYNFNDINNINNCIYVIYQIAFNKITASFNIENVDDILSTEFIINSVASRFIIKHKDEDIEFFDAKEFGEFCETLCYQDQDL